MDNLEKNEKNLTFFCIDFPKFYDKIRMDMMRVCALRHRLFVCQTQCAALRVTCKQENKVIK